MVNNLVILAERTVKNRSRVLNAQALSAYPKTPLAVIRACQVLSSPGITPLVMSKMYRAVATMAAVWPKRGIILIMMVENKPSSLTLSDFSFVVEEAGGLIERTRARVWRETQAALRSMLGECVC